MSKKKRRSRKSSAAKRRQAQAAQKPAAKSPKVSKSKSARGSGGKKEVDFASEYHYVASDLKRFAFLAVAMFATLVVLALVLQ